MKRIKKLGSYLLTLCMVLALTYAFLGVNVYASDDQAAIGYTTYATLEEALDAATSRSTIRLLSDVTLTSSYTIASTRHIALDLNGHTITATDTSLNGVGKKDGTTISDSNGLLNVEGTLSIGNGTISMNESSSATYALPIFYVATNGQLNIYSGTYKTLSYSIIYNNGGSVKIRNGDFLFAGTNTQAAVYDSKSLITSVAGSVAFQEGSLTAGGEDDCGFYGIYGKDGATVTLGDHHGDGPEITTYCAPLGSNNTTATTTYNILGGTYTTTWATSVEAYKKYNAAIFMACDGALNISGGTFNAPALISLPYVNTATAVTITGGYFNGSLFYLGSATGNAGSGTKTLVITGGYYTETQSYTDDVGYVSKETSTISAVTQTVNNVTYSSQVTARQATGISVATAPTKTAYIEDEALDPTGLVLNVTYDNGTTGQVAYGDAMRDFRFSLRKVSTDDTSVTITYQEMTTTQAITVTPKSISAIEVVRSPRKSEYTSGETFDPSGLVLKVSYDNGTYKYVTYTSENADDFSFDKTTLSEGDTSVTLTYRGFTASIGVSVGTKDIAKANAYLETTTYTYTGSAITPAIKVYYQGIKLTEGTDYTVAYSNNTEVGKATITVRGIGNYSGTLTKFFNIKSAETTTPVTPANDDDDEVDVDKPAITNINKPAKKKIKIKVRKSNVSGYQVVCSATGCTTKTTTSSATTLTVTGLKSKTTYTVKVRAFVTTSSGKTYSSWTTKKVKVK